MSCLNTPSRQISSANYIWHRLYQITILYYDMSPPTTCAVGDWYSTMSFAVNAWYDTVSTTSYSLSNCYGLFVSEKESGPVFVVAVGEIMQMPVLFKFKETFFQGRSSNKNDCRFFATSLDFCANRFSLVVLSAHALEHCRLH